MTRPSPPPPPPPGAPRPGWYADPWRHAVWRWWDGRAWTVHTHGPAPGARARRTLPAWASWPVLLCAAPVAIGVLLAAVLSPVAVALTVPPLAIVYASFTWIDRIEPEPRHSRVHATLWGATVAVVGAVVINTVVTIAAGEVVGVVVSAPIVEEVLKIGGVVVAATWRREVDGPVDGVVFAGWVAAGFAAVENVLYLVEAAASGALTGTFVVRGLLSPFAHPLFTLPAGLAIGWAVSRRRSVVAWAAIGAVPAIALHALWNAATILAVGPSVAIAVGLLAGFVALFVVAVVTVIVWRRRQVRTFVALVPRVAHVYGLHPHELAAFSDWRGLLRTRRGLPDRASRRRFDAVHGAVARLATIEQRPGGPTPPERERAAEQLRRARAST